MKRRHARPYGFALSFQDMLMAMIAVYAFLFLTAYALIKPDEGKAGVPTKAEYLLTLEWPQASLDDIDLHLLLPDRSMVDFRSREVEHAMLDHDDIGTNGVYRKPDGQMVRIGEHKETISLRAIVPGDYVANVHVYRVNDAADAPADTPRLPFTVKVRLMKLNPRVEEVAVADVPLERLGEQKTAFEFRIGETGEVSVDKTADVPFIPMLPRFAQS
jgi:hypothetical protein